MKTEIFMKTEMMKIAATLLLTAVSYSAHAENDERLPGKTGDIGSATGKTASCLINVQNLDLKEIVIHTDYKVDKLAMIPFAGDERLQAKKTLNVGNNYQVVLSVTLAPERSINYKGQDLLILDSRLQRIEANGQKTVLTTIMTSSDDEYLTEPTDKFISAGLHIENPEILTVAVNLKTPMSAYGLLEAGLIPNGILSDVSVSCYVVPN